MIKKERVRRKGKKWNRKRKIKTEERDRRKETARECN